MRSRFTKILIFCGFLACVAQAIAYYQFYMVYEHAMQQYVVHNMDIVRIMDSQAEITLARKKAELSQ